MKKAEGILVASSAPLAAVANSSLDKRPGQGVLVLLWDDGADGVAAASERLIALATSICATVCTEACTTAPRCATVAVNGSISSTLPGCASMEATTVVGRALVPPLLRAVDMGEPASYLSAHHTYDIPPFIPVGVRCCAPATSTSHSTM